MSNKQDKDKLYQIGVIFSVRAQSYDEAIASVVAIKDDIVIAVIQSNLPIKSVQIENELPSPGDGEVASFHHENAFYGGNRAIYLHPEDEPLD